jgi:hypothetical protein
MVAGLIVVGNQGLSGRFSRMRRFLMGGVSESVTRYARCSVMVVRKDLYDRPSTLGAVREAPLRLAKVAKQGGLAYVIYGQHPHEVAIPDDRQGLEAALL